MLAAVIVLAVLAAAQQILNAALLLGLRSQREGLERLADNLGEVLGMTLELAKKAFPKEKAPAKAPKRKPNAKGEVLYKGSYMKKEAADVLDKMDKKIAAAERKASKGKKEKK